LLQCMSPFCRFCCKRQLKPFRVSDSVPLMRLAMGADDDGLAQSRSGTTFRCVFKRPIGNAALAGIGHGLFVRYTRMVLTAAAESLGCTIPVVCLPAVIVLGSPMRASRNQPMNVVYRRRRTSGCDWVGALTCSMISRKSRKACIGGPTSACAAFIMQRKRVHLSD
jgi:hypothetical protein